MTSGATEFFPSFRQKLFCENYGQIAHQRQAGPPKRTSLEEFHGLLAVHLKILRLYISQDSIQCSLALNRGLLEEMCYDIPNVCSCKLSTGIVWLISGGHRWVRTAIAAFK